MNSDSVRTPRESRRELEAKAGLSLRENAERMDDIEGLS